VRPAELEALGVALGPGSFTSLRIGLALAKGISLALHLPVVGVPSLDIVAAMAPESNLPLVAVLQAGRGRLAVAFYSTVMGSAWQSQGEPKVMTVDDLSDLVRKPTMIWGELTAHERQVLARKRKNVLLASPAQALRRPSYLAEIAWKRFQEGKTDEVVGLAPIYLHVAEPIPG
jgi:tRNA threonylcarbamoyladenosine biosynthesis protein TsaB